MSDLNEAFRQAGIEYSQRRIAEKESPADTGELFKQHAEALLARRREESGIEDLLD